MFIVSTAHNPNRAAKHGNAHLVRGRIEAAHLAPRLALTLRSTAPVLTPIGQFSFCDYLGSVFLVNIGKFKYSK